jgi:hypothetical protein
MYIWDFASRHTETFFSNMSIYIYQYFSIYFHELYKQSQNVGANLTGTLNLIEFESNNLRLSGLQEMS